MLNNLQHSETVIRQPPAMSALDAWIEVKQIENNALIAEIAEPASYKEPADPVVVVVDDEPIVAVTLAEILSRNGIAAVWFTDPREALRLFKTSRVDLLLSDLVMPGIDGIQLSREVHALQPSCLLFLFSGNAEDTNIRERIEATGLAIFLAAKPLCPRRLIQTVHSLIDHSRQAA